MKLIFSLLFVISFFGCDLAYAKQDNGEIIKEVPRMTDLSAKRKKRGGDDLATRAKSANTLPALKQIVLDLIEMETGGK